MSASFKRSSSWSKKMAQLGKELALRVTASAVGHALIDLAKELWNSGPWA